MNSNGSIKINELRILRWIESVTRLQIHEMATHSINIAKLQDTADTSQEMMFFRFLGFTLSEEKHGNISIALVFIGKTDFFQRIIKH